MPLLLVGGEVVVVALRAAAASLGLSQGRMRLCTAAKHVWVICRVRCMTTGASLFPPRALSAGNVWIWTLCRCGRLFD